MDRWTDNGGREDPSWHGFSQAQMSFSSLLFGRVGGHVMVLHMMYGPIASASNSAPLVLVARFIHRALESMQSMRSSVDFQNGHCHGWSAIQVAIRPFCNSTPLRAFRTQPHWS
eukprot:825381-Amphidinium_carterae.1